MKTKYLSEVTNIKSGNSAPQGEEPFVNGKYNFYRTYDVGQIKQGEIFESRDKVNKETYSNLKIFPVNTILFPKSGASTFNNNRVIIKKEGAIASHLAGIKANPEFLNDYYLYYFLLTIDSRNLAQDSAYPSVNLKQISQVKIPVPSLREQEKIVERLDEIFSSISGSIQFYESKLENISKLKQSYIDEIFFNYEDTADEVVLDDVSTIVGRIGYRGYTKKDLVSEGSGALSLSPSNIKNDEMTYIKNTFISWEKYEESPEIKIYDGDIIFCKTGSTYGKVAIVKDLNYKATLNPQLVVLKNLNIDNEILFYQLLTSKFKKFIESIVGGTATPTLSQTNLGRAKILNLNKKIQKDLIIKINTFLKKRNLLENNYKQMINLLKELKTSILTKEFKYE